MSVYVLSSNGKESWKMIRERIRIATKNIEWPDYLSAKFGDGTSSGFCVIMLTHAHTHTPVGT